MQSLFRFVKKCRKFEFSKREIQNDLHVTLFLKVHTRFENHK